LLISYAKSTEPKCLLGAVFHMVVVLNFIGFYFFFGKRNMKIKIEI
jgi:hypothetical protein